MDDYCAARSEITAAATMGDSSNDVLTYTPDSFGNWFKKCRNDAGLPRYNLHTLRKLLAVHFAESEATENGIAAVLALNRAGFAGGSHS